MRASGLKKTARARAALTLSDKLIIMINGLSYSDAFEDAFCQSLVLSVFEAIRCFKFQVRAVASGGGKVAQAYAVRAAIAKCVLALNPSVRRALKWYGLLTADCRRVERKKCGLAKARRAFQFSKR